MGERNEQDFVSVFKGPIPEADIVKVVLEEAGIRCWLDNEATSVILSGMTAPQPGEAHVLVAGKDADRARAEIERSRGE